MVVENHKIAYRNVASKYYRFSPEEIDLAVEDFVAILAEYDCQPTGTIFYAMISDPTEEVMTAELFLPIEEDLFNIPASEEIAFRSYFSVDQMLMTRVMKDFETDSQVKYWELFGHMEERNLKKRTPVFVEIKQSPEGENYAEMSVGVL